MHRLLLQMEDTNKTGTPEPDWLGLCRHAVEGIEAVVTDLPHTGDRNPETGVGAGGDQTLLVDKEAEDAVFDELESLSAEGHSFTAISEERGEVVFGETTGVKVVIDPIDGSLNAKRTIPFFTLSIAVASGDSMEDVGFGYIYDFGAREEFHARLGEGAWMNGQELKPIRDEQADVLEILAIEGTNPLKTAQLAERLQGMVYRLRAFGTIALSLSYVAAGRCDGLITMHPCRSVDAAAGQLIAREAGTSVELIANDDGAKAGLDLESRYICVAASTEDWKEKLKKVVGG